MNEAQLERVVAAAALGQPWALRDLYEELAPAVVGYLRARGASEPEDLTSEVFLTVFPRLAGVTGGARGLRTFVFSVAHARLVDDLRRRSRRPVAVGFEPEVHDTTAPSAEDDALTGMSADTVRRALATLPDDQREVLLMRIVGDLTVEEVAAAMGRSAGAVKQLQRRGLVALREQVRRTGVPL